MKAFTFALGVSGVEGEEMEIFSHDKSMGFDNPVRKRRKDKNASIFYDSGLNDHEDHCISPQAIFVVACRSSITQKAMVM